MPLLEPSPEPLDAVAVALQRCKAPEQALARALNRQLGPDGAARVIDQVRETDRANLIQAVEALRASPKKARRCSSACAERAYSPNAASPGARSWRTLA